MINRGKVAKINRRDDVKELYLKGLSISEIASKLGCCKETVSEDIDFLQSYYTKLAINNPHIAERQYTRIEKLLEEIDLVKKEYYAILEDIKKKIEEDEKKKTQILGERPNGKIYITQRVETLKAIMSRIENEARILNLANPANRKEENSISLEVLKQILLVFRGIINDLIPEDKRDYAIKRMQVIDIKAINGQEIIKKED